MNLNLQAHVTHRVNVEHTFTTTQEVVGMDISPDPYKPTAPAVVTVNYLVLSETPPYNSKLYCRDCDVYLVGNWEFA